MVLNGNLPRAYSWWNCYRRPSEGEHQLPGVFKYSSNLYQKDIIKTAFENGINMFDTAEAYAKGKSEVEM